MKSQKTANKTHVVWSFDLNLLDEEAMDRISLTQVDAVRITGRYQSVVSLLNKVKALRERFDRQGKSVPLIVDSVRKARGFVCGFSEPREFELNKRVKVTCEGGGGDLEVQTDEWEGFFRVGNPVFVGAGDVALVPEVVENDSAVMIVSQSGQIHSGEEVHCPITRRPADVDIVDQELLSQCHEYPVDFVVLPGFESAEELKKIRKTLRARSRHHPWLIMKVDSLRVYESLAETLPEVHGVLISRFEIGMCTDPARVPMITKEVVQKCNESAKLVMIASDILRSMRRNATPTRAEVSDIANAAMDGADAVILSDELTRGRHAQRGLEIARRAIEDIELKAREHQLNWLKGTPSVSHMLGAVTFAAYRTARRNNVKAIVCLTNHGNTSLLLSSFRTDIPIFAVTLHEHILRRVGLIKGVTGIYLDESPEIDYVLPMINDRIVRDTWLESGDKIVFVSVSLSSVGEKASNLFTIQTLK